MKIIIVAGTPGAGKTAVLLHVLENLIKCNTMPSVVKIDCLYTEDDKRFAKIGIPVKVGLSKDMCPDHFAIYNYESMIEWAHSQKSGLLLIETAGLCHRCAPYTKNSLGVCVIDATTGPNTPLKLGPFLSTSDFAIVTKGDIISQAEREIFRERILEVNPSCTIIEANGLSGKGCSELAKRIIQSADVCLSEDKLRHSAPISVCTLCAGEVKINKKYHRGFLRSLDGMQFFEGE
jgi:Ni2+-binding GTPase involved in maturation of urease and hydrogenase